MNTITLAERLAAYHQYPLLRRWWLRARMVFFYACCFLGWHSPEGGYSKRVWCWVCGKRIFEIEHE